MVGAGNYMYLEDPLPIEHQSGECFWEGLVVRGCFGPQAWDRIRAELLDSMHGRGGTTGTRGIHVFKPCTQRLAGICRVARAGSWQREHNSQGSGQDG